MKRFALICLLVSGFGLAQAQGSGEFSLGVATQDIWRGALVNDDLTFIPMADFSLGTGTHLTARGSLRMQGHGVDEWRWGIRQDLDLVAATLSFGATLYDRDADGADTTEVWASAKMKWLLPFTFFVARDVDLTDGMYVRASTGSSLGAGALGANVEVGWDLWLGWADDKFAATYGSGDAGFADLGGRLTARFAIDQASVSVWAQATTLVDPDFHDFMGDRSNFELGASVGWRF
jgi:hypothetical protein